MNRENFSMTQVLAGAALAVWSATAQPADKIQNNSSSDNSNQIFGFDKIHRLHLVMSAKEWEAMQPDMTRNFIGFPGIPAQQKESADSKSLGERPVHRGNMVEYPLARGDLIAGEITYSNVSVRYKGNFTYMASARALKRSLKIDFDPDDKDTPGYHGLSKINLHAGVLDPTRQREALSYEVFRAAGVPAPRTAFAELTLTVPGHYDKEYVGLYALVEQVDGQFLKNWFTSSKGLLMKPQGVRGPEYLGEKWEEYESRYRPNRTPTREEALRVIHFAQLVSNADDDQFRLQINSFLDVNRFLRFLAANAMLVNLDSPLAMPQNFYLYLDGETQRFIFMPWDLDLSLAAWPMGGPPEKQMDLNLMHPHVGRHPLIDRLLALPDVRAKYQAILKELSASAFAKERLLKNIEIIEGAIQKSLAKEAKAVAARQEYRDGRGFGPGPDIAAQAPTPRVFIEKRTESIQAQLSGTRQGYTPTTSFRFPGGPR